MVKDQPFPEYRLVWPSKELELLVQSATQKAALVVVVTDYKKFDSFFLATGLAIRLAKTGVKLFALVGKDSEKAHDALDWALQKDEAENIVTSWHASDAADVASFVVTSCRVSNLNLLIASFNISTDFGKALQSQIKDEILISNQNLQGRENS